MMNKFEIGSQWKTRDGEKVMILHHRDSGGMDVFSYVEHEPHCYDADGRFSCLQADREECKGYDLIEPWQDPRSGEFWVNVYASGFAAAGMDTKDEADAAADWGGVRLACVKVNWTEGEGLDKENE